MLNQIFADLNIHHPIISNNEIFNHSDSFQCFFFYWKVMDCKKILISRKSPFKDQHHCVVIVALFPSVHTSLFMFHLSSASPHVIDDVSFLFPSVYSPSRSYLPYLLVFMLHGHSTILSVSLSTQSRFWKLKTYKCL